MNDNCCDKCANMTGCCCCMDASEYKKYVLTEVVQNDERQCTDLPCCCLLVACIVLEILIIISCSESGANPSLLLHGADYNGTLCDGEDNHGPYTVWPSLSYYDIRLCSWSCNSFTNNPNNKLMINKYESISFMDAYCIPKHITSFDNIDTKLADYSENMERGLSDLATTKWLILIMAFVAIIISFIYLKLISFLSKVLIILTIFCALIAGVFFAYLLIEHGVQDYSVTDTQSIGLTEIIAGVVIIIVLICLIFALWFSRKNIELVCDVLNEANHAIYDMKLTLIWPIWMSFLGIAYIAYWVTEALYIYSVKKQITEPMPSIFIENGGYSNTYQDFKFDYYYMRDQIICHFVILFYSIQVLIYFSYMVLAGVFSDWYFSDWESLAEKHKQRGDGVAELSTSPICESLWRVTRFHLGSLALGALFLFFIEILEGIVNYIRGITKNAKNPMTKCIFSMVSCCLKCFECIFNRINKNGFIITSIYGTSYCYSSYAAVRIVMNNFGTTVLMSSVSKYTEFFGKFIISIFNTGIAVIVMKWEPYYSNNVESFLFPCIVIFIISYTISSLFMMVFNVAVHSIFLSFLVDDSVNVTGPRFARKEMKELVNSKKHLNKGKGDSGDGHIEIYTAV